MSALIQINIYDYEDLSSIGKRVTQYVNSNLRDIIQVLIDILESDPGFDLDGFFPRDYLMRKPQECRNSVDELYEIVCSNSVRDFIKPKYEYLMYAILCWWEDCVDDKTELISNKIDDNLKNDLENEDDGKYILRLIQDFEEYYDMCFQDHDFLPEPLSNMVMLYLQNPKLLKMFFHYDNLDNYIDLMEYDLRERYLETLRKRNNDPCIPMPDNIVSELINVIKRFEKRIVDFEKRNEVQITADIQDAIAGNLNSKYDLHVTREFTMGRAKKELGETDLYIYAEKDGHITDYAVLENKYIKNFTNQYNQLMGYLNHNFKFGITLSMNRDISLKKGFDKIEEELNNIKGDFQPINIQRIEKDDNIMIVSEHIVPETGNRMEVFHLIFQLNDNERKRAAAIARKK
nr:hypothetical protein [Clostridium putrefaciens]